MGKQAVDGDANQVGQMLAGKLGWPQATFAASIELAADKKSLTVGREVDGGVEYKRSRCPSVVTVDLRIVAPHAVKNGVTPDVAQLLRRGRAAAVAQGHHGGEEEADDGRPSSPTTAPSRSRRSRSCR